MTDYEREIVLRFNVETDIGEQFVWSIEEMVEKWLAKHKGYGPQNIGLLGPIGVVTRMFDKMARFHTAFGFNSDAPKLNPEQANKVRSDALELATYGIMLNLLLEGKWPRTKFSEMYDEKPETLEEAMEVIDTMAATIREYHEFFSKMELHG